MQTLLVTGGAGFIGSCFVRQTLASGPVRVVTLDKLTYAGHRESLGEALEHPHHLFIHGDITSRRLVKSLLREYKPQAIVHFAAESHVDRSIDGPASFLRTNVVGTVALLDAACEYWERLPYEQQNAFRFLHVSTDEVYGSLGTEGAFCETSPYAPNSPYAASKAAADHFVRAYGRTFELPVLVTHSTNNYGPYQYPEKLIPLVICRALRQRSLPVYGDGQQVRDWLYVEDHCQALRAILERGRPGEAYGISANDEHTNLAVVHDLCELLDRLAADLPHRPCADLIRFVADRPGHDRRYALDSTKLRRELGWQPAVSFEEGLERTVRWYLEQGQWLASVTGDAYHSERLGLRRTRKAARADASAGQQLSRRQRRCAG